MNSLKEMPKNLQDFLSYLSFKSECIFHQERQKIKVDIEAAKELEHKLSTLIETKTKTLIDVMPKITKMKPVNRPKQWTKIDGSLTSKAIEFEQKRREAGMPEGILSFNVVSEVINGNPSSTPQVKDWLFSLGWKPCTFKYSKDNEGNPKQVPQVRVEGELTPSVERLCETVPELKHYSDLGILSHRHGIVKSFLSASKDGYVSANATGLTNTMRLKHSKPVVNLPSVDKPWGKEIRGLLTCEDSEVLVGSDLVSLENSTKLHYMSMFDKETVEIMSKDDYDPHLSLLVSAGKLSTGDYEFYVNYKRDGTGSDTQRFRGIDLLRKKAKVVNYSSLYGVGASKLSQSSGMSLPESKELLDEFWNIHSSIKKVTNKTRVKTLKDGSMWAYNPVSKFWYSLRYERDIWSTINQSTGVFVFDTWLNFCSQKEQWPVLQMHDEQLVRTTKDNSLGVREIMLWAIQRTNEKLGLNVEIKIDIQEGKSYAECH